MARSNLMFHGFQFYKTLSGNDWPTTIRGFVADNYNTALYEGLPVTRLSDGSYQKCAANSGSISGVISKIVQFKDATGVLRNNAKYIPASTRWTALEEATMIEIIPARGHLFKVCSDALATFANARSYEGENADHVYKTSGDGAISTSLGLSGCFLDLGSHAVTATLQWRLRHLLGDEGGRSTFNDPTAVWHAWVVEPNLILDVPGLPAALGV